MWLFCLYFAWKSNVFKNLHKFSLLIFLTSQFILIFFCRAYKISPYGCSWFTEWRDERQLYKVRRISRTQAGSINISVIVERVLWFIQSLSQWSWLLHHFIKKNSVRLVPFLGGGGNFPFIYNIYPFYNIWLLRVLE